MEEAKGGSGGRGDDASGSGSGVPRWEQRRGHDVSGGGEWRREQAHRRGCPASQRTACGISGTRRAKREKRFLLQPATQQGKTVK